MDDPNGQQSAASWRPPREFDGYGLSQLLGHGGMGDVYLGHDTLLDRPIAIKFIRANDPLAREMFLNEARAAAKLQHPNVVSIYRVGEIAGHPYIISEYIRGRSLDKLPRPVPWQRVLEIAIALARGLSAAHHRGILHRDLKPSNAMESAEAEIKLCDFGLAKLLTAGEPSLPSAADTAPEPAVPALKERSLTLDWSPVAVPLPKPVARGASLVTAHAAAAALPITATASPPSHLKGTPGYLAPEVLRGEPASPLSDLYGLGALLFALCSDGPPFQRLPLSELVAMVNTVDAPPLTERAPGVDPRLAAIVDRCLQRDPQRRFATADELLDALQELRPGSEALPLPPGNPYRGLLPFEAEHRSVFFGRRSEIGTIVERLRTEPLLIVVADSGTGKSSLIRAGVLPVLREGGLGQGRSWQTEMVIPGRQPLRALRDGLCALLGQPLPDCAPAELGRELARRLGRDRGAVLFIDQVEELITLSPPAEARLAGEVIAALAAGAPGVRLVMTARADYLSRLGALPGLGGEITRAFYLLRPLGREQLHDVIVGPAAQHGVRFESAELVDELVDSTATTAGALPLLQFALAELWEVKRGSVITRAALGSIGGVAGALSRHGDHVFSLLPQSQRSCARRILMELITLDGTRAHRSEKELVHEPERDREVLATLVAARLVLTRETPEGTIYEVAHEALLTGWGSLQKWLEAHAGVRALQQRLTAAATEWQRLGQRPEVLWSTAQVAEVATLASSDLGPLEASFVRASQQAVRQQQRWRQALLVAVPLVVLSLYGAFRWLSTHELSQRVESNLVQNRVLLAEAATSERQLVVLRTQAFALFDAQKREEAEQVWSKLLQLSASTDRLYSRACQNLEVTLSLDHSRKDVRGLLADALYARALGAERNHEGILRDDLLARLKLYDSQGVRQQKWYEPGRLRVVTQPAGAQVTVAQYIPDAEQKLRLQPLRELGTTPLAEQVVPQGSYLLMLTAADRTAVRYPILMGRGEDLNIQIELLPASAIPRGFIYIPDGRTLFGVAGEESLRLKFFNTAPAHQIVTAGFFISRYETTYGEYIDFLSALPESERERHRPRSGGTLPTGGGTVDLSQDKNGRWLLHLQPQTLALRQTTGEPIVYPSRAQNARQDWYRLPVTGISRLDAEVYATWLAAAGRVPGARLCTEFEWERAARGAGDRDYPHGDGVSPQDANIDLTYGKKLDAMGPDEVGRHPASQSPFGVDDMLGNAYEPARSSLSPEETVGRGGSYGFDVLTGRSVNRNPLDTSYRGSEVGLRLCASLPKLKSP